MLLTMDIGNTNINIGLFKGDNLALSVRLGTERQKTDDQYAMDFTNIFVMHKIDFNDIDGVVISSVVPEITESVTNAIKKLTGKDALILSPGVKTGLNILIDNPAQLGADLAVGAVAAKSKYSLPCVILDLGTATTISVLDKDGAFLGGQICAGLNISLEALNNKTSQLPGISLDTPKSVIGRNSIDCMKAGLVIGTACMIDGLIDRIEEELGQKVSVVATGGLAGEVIKNCKRKIELNDNLLLDGLREIYFKNKK